MYSDIKNKKKKNRTNVYIVSMFINEEWIPRA